VVTRITTNDVLMLVIGPLELAEEVIFGRLRVRELLLVAADKVEGAGRGVGLGR
jgi:hypothetical protein